jgi:glycosyltransferase involved in cell wall biosynthesis
LDPRSSPDTIESVPEKARILNFRTGKLRLGFVCIEDASDIRTWSGTPFHILSHLQSDPEVEVQLFSPLDRRMRYALTPAKLFATLRHRSFMPDRSPLLLRSYARQIERRFRAHPVDVVFSTSSIPVTFLRCPQPIVIWTDAVLHSMIGYYNGVFDTVPSSAIETGKRQEFTALQRCAAAIYSSRWAAAAAATLTDPQKIHVLPFGSSLPSNSTPENIALEARKKRESRPNSCKLLFIGADWVRKGGDMAIEVARNLNESGTNTTLQMVGATPPANSPSFVEALGFIDKSTEQGTARLTSLYQEADFFLLPTKAEASAIVFCEASSFGLPTLTHDTGGVRDYIKDGVNGVCLPLSARAADFADEIRAWLSHPADYEALAVGAFLEYRNRLNWRSSTHRLVEICRSLAVPHPPPAHTTIG